MGLFDQDRAEPTLTESNHSVKESANEYADGIYFNLPEDKYHALERLSASGIKNILISIPTFWAKSWMNPEVADNDDDDTKAQILGRAYHVAIFEPETLAHRYAGEPDLADFEGMVMTDTEVKAALKEYGAPQSKTGEASVDRALRLAELGFAKPIKSLVLAEFQEALGDRQPIGSKYWTQIMRDLERIKANPEIHDLVNGGASEVTILWTCPDSGIPMKARIDKLKQDCFVDLKSFANSNGKQVNQAINDQVQFYKYYLSMRAYQIAISMIRKLDLQVIDEPDALTKAERGDIKNNQNNLIDVLRAKNTPHQPWLFFQEKGGIPNLLARKLKLQRFPEGVDMQSTGAEDHTFSQSDGVLCRKADIEIQRAKQLFLQAMTIYGPDQEWYPMDMIGEIGDEDFRDYFLDSVPA
jgi:hypothetical protein